MKRTIALILAMLIALTCAAFAEVPDVKALTDAELEQLIKDAQTELDARKGTEAAEEAPAEEAPAEEVQYEILQKGSKNEAAKALQKRLIELKYLEGKADGSYGNKTVAAVKLFQTQIGMEATGIADAATQKALFAEDAPEAKTFLKLNYKDMERDPNSYIGKEYEFTGKVFQLVGEQENGDTVFTVLMIATKGTGSNLAYVYYMRPKDNPRILEDDSVTVYATFDGLYTYETVRGNSNTILQFTASIVS